MAAGIPPGGVALLSGRVRSVILKASLQPLCSNYSERNRDKCVSLKVRSFERGSPMEVIQLFCYFSGGNSVEFVIAPLFAFSLSAQ